LDDLSNMFFEPTRRDVLRWGVACGAAGALCHATSASTMAQDVASGLELTGPKLEGVARNEAMFWEKLDEKKVKCVLCPRECVVADVERGYCGVRENQGGKYQTLVYGALCSANVDPIEKKPLFHYQPGTTAFSIATAGCNIECKFCQNWQISQFRPEQVNSVLVTPDRLISACKARRSPTIAYTYSEPVIFYEYMHDTAALAREHGIGSVMISNGYIQEKPLRQLCKHVTGVKIDLKAFTEKFYVDSCAGELQPVLKTLEILRDIGIWLELVVLIIPTPPRRRSRWPSGWSSTSVRTCRCTLRVSIRRTGSRTCRGRRYRRLSGAAGSRSMRVCTTSTPATCRCTPARTHTATTARKS